MNMFADPDLYLALGNIVVHLNVTVTVLRNGDVTSVVVEGEVSDLYDFHFDGDPAELVKPATRVQSGYNTLGISGKVYKSKVMIEGELENAYALW